MTQRPLFSLVICAALAGGCATGGMSPQGEPAKTTAASPQKHATSPSSKASAAAKAKATTAGAQPAGPTLGPPPATPVRPVTNTYFGVKVVDPYQWLENWKQPQVKAWSESQNSYARKFLDDLPHRKAIAARVSDLMTSEGIVYSSVRHAGKLYFALKRQPPKQQRFIVVMQDLDHPGAARTVVDPNAIDPSGHTAIDFYRASPDGTKVAVSMSKGGSESGDLHIFDVATGKQIGAVIPRVNGGTAGGDAAWTPDGKGIYYTRYPAPGERPAKDLAFFQQLWFHRLGTPIAKDHYEIGKKFPRIAEVQVETDRHTDHVICTVQDGDSDRFAFWLRQGRGRWKKLAGFDDHVKQITFGPRHRLYVLSHADAPKGKILSMPLNNPVLSKAKVVVPQGDDAIAFDYEFGPNLVTTDHAVFATYQLGGPDTVKGFSPDGKALPAPKTLPISAVYGVAPAGGDAIVYANESYTKPLAWYRYDPKTKQTHRTALVTASPVSFADTAVQRVFATSKDGTKVPVTLMYEKGTPKDGKNPALITGYGGYGLSITPYFNPLRHLWIEQGAVLAVANIRGGGEYGDKWHDEGRLTHKQNVFDDFAASMQLLIDAGWTSPAHLAITGGSNGGLLMGAMITQHPKLFRCVVSYVGIYDMLRVQLSPNGAFNIPEYGTVKNAAQFKALYAYSPYHHVVKGTPYPAVLFMTGANDPRVDPMQSRKMTARLQAATTSKRPVLLRTSSDTGHGIGSPLEARIAEAVDADSFMFYELGLGYHAPTKASAKAAAKAHMANSAGSAHG